MKKFAVLFFSAVFPFVALSQEQVPLWAGGAPGYENKQKEPEVAKEWYVRNIHNPSLVVFLPPKEKATGAAVLICPGGGFRSLVYNSEGKDPALFLTNLGITAIVLKYRLFREEGSPYTYEKETKEDALRGMRLARSKAKEWGFDPNRLGIMGFSAGGEVVAMASYHSDEGDPKSNDPVERVSSKPNFQILIYPGPLGVPDKVPSDAPPAFLLTANLDECCSEPVIKTLRAYREAKVPVEAHIYDKGGHGFNMGYKTTLKSIKSWPGRLAEWFEDNYYFDPAKKEEAAKAK